MLRNYYINKEWIVSQTARSVYRVAAVTQQHAQQEIGIDRRTPRLAVAVFQSLAYKPETDVLIDQPQQMVLGDLVLQPEVIEQRFTLGTFPGPVLMEYNYEGRTPFALVSRFQEREALSQ